MYLSAFVVPIEGDANVSFACPVVGNFVIAFESILQVDSMFLASVLDAKVIND